MKLYYISLLLFSCRLLVAQEENDSVTADSPAGGNADLFDSSFFSGVLDQSGLGDDAMGTQRVVDQRNSVFSPSIIFSTNYNYSSNPLASADNSKIWEDGFLTTFMLGFNLGIGEFALGDEVLLTPSLFLSHSRTYYDLVKDNGDKWKDLDADSQVVSVSFPFFLPKDFVFRVSHTYFRPINFRDDRSDMYINSPSFSFEKQVALPSGGVFNFSAGAGLSITEGSDYLSSLLANGISLEEAIFIRDTLPVIEGVPASSSRPTNLQDSWNHQIALSYIHPISEKLIAIPSYSYSKSVYTKGRYLGRVDNLSSFGLNFSYALAEWLNLSALSNYSIKNTNENGNKVDIADYENFIGGVAFGINYAF